MHRLIKYFFITLFLFFTNTVFADQNCHPEIDSSKSQYILGYGSFMNESSVRQTDPQAGRNIPIELLGYQRRWGIVPQRAKSEMFVGIVKKPGQLINGVVFKLSTPEILAKFDNREIGYCREAVSPASFNPLIQIENLSGQFWLYTPMNHLFKNPSQRYPISQAYVDVFLSGCLALEKRYDLEGFAAQCVLTTKKWGSAWLKNRQPEKRAYVSKDDMKKVDDLLKKTLFDLYKKINISP